MNINDEAFEQTITLKQSYEVMYQFIMALHDRGEVDTGWILGCAGLLEDGGSADPAQLDDYLDAYKKVKTNAE